ncbi:hypothetical protein BB558_007274 [Smittium angustum]|uniref:MADS-box domain-containing protein n=1 Tax=Smittium angustum TaxID=133377 RepID=A0A2U1IVG5_SMIAN|nr:hypothetical protein BB558_007274 [Smittium angustum]
MDGKNEKTALNELLYIEKNIHNNQFDIANNFNNNLQSTNESRVNFLLGGISQNKDKEFFNIENISENYSEGKEEANEKKTEKPKNRRKKIKIEFIEQKSRRNITFSKRKAGIMKKAYELSKLTGSQILLLIVSESGLVYTFTTTKFQSFVSSDRGKKFIHSCLVDPGNKHMPLSSEVENSLRSSNYCGNETLGYRFGGDTKRKIGYSQLPYIPSSQLQIGPSNNINMFGNSDNTRNMHGYFRENMSTNTGVSVNVGMGTRIGTSNGMNTAHRPQQNVEKFPTVKLIESTEHRTEDNRSQLNQTNLNDSVWTKAENSGKSNASEVSVDSLAINTNNKNERITKLCGQIPTINPYSTDIQIRKQD